MLQILFAFIVLFLSLPALSEAAYNIYLKNGSVISGISSYERQGNEITIYLGSGSVKISGKDILKIEETTGHEKNSRTAESSEKIKAASAGSPEPTDNRNERLSALQSEIEKLEAEIRNKEDEEKKITALINEKSGKRYRYNYYQLRQLEKELEPLQQELFIIQQKKSELMQKKSNKENEIKAFE